MRRLQPVPYRSTSNTSSTSNAADDDRQASAALPENHGSPCASSRRGAGPAGVPEMPPVRECQPTQTTFRGPTRATPLQSARNSGAPLSSNAKGRVLPGRTVPASRTAQSIDISLDEWVHADSEYGEARQQAALMIQVCRADKKSTLNLSGLHLGQLPDCMDRIALTDLQLANCQLQTLPQLPSTLITLTVRQNQLTGLPRLPSNLLKLDATANKLQRLQGLPATLQTLAAGGNQLTTLRHLPRGLITLDLSSNQFNRLPDLPATLRYLNVSNNLPMDLHGLPPKLCELEICHMRLLSLPTLPSGLTKLWARDNNLIELCALPSGLTHLNVSGNRLYTLPALPTTMSHLIARSNRIRQLPALPDALVKLDVSHNALTGLPASITTAPRLSHIDLSLNQIPGPELDNFVGTMNALGKNMSYIYFDRVERGSLHAEASVPSTALQDLALIPPIHGGEDAPAPPGSLSPVPRSRGERVTDSIATQVRMNNEEVNHPNSPMLPIPAAQSEAHETSAAKPTTIPAPSVARHGTAASLIDEWHMVDESHEWEVVHPDELQRPEAN